MCPPCRKLPPRLTTLGCCSLESVPQMLAAQSAAGAELDRARDLEAIRLATKEKLFIDVRDQSMWSVHGTAGQIRRKPPRALAAQSAVPGPAGVVSPGGWVEPGAPLGPTAQDLQLMGPPPGPVPAPSGPRGPAPVSPPELCVFPKEATRQDSPMGPAVHRMLRKWRFIIRASNSMDSCPPSGPVAAPAPRSECPASRLPPAPPRGRFSEGGAA